MDAPRESSIDEVTRLRGCLNDLAGLMALPTLSTGGDPAQVVSSLLDTLIDALRLVFVCVRLKDPEGGPSVEMERVAEWPRGTARSDYSLASVRFGPRGEIGILVAGSDRPEFPTETDRLLLHVATNQATIGLQQARLAAERTRREDASRGTDRESRQIMDTIPGLVAILTPAGVVDVVNHQLVEYCGQPLEAMRQWGTNGTVHPEDGPGIAPVFPQAITAGHPYDFEARIRRFDGVYCWFQVRGLPLRDATGRIARWYVLLTDIDERKRAEEALRANALNFQLTVDSIPGMVHTMTASGAVEFVNQQILDYFGKTLEELNNWDTLLHPDDRSRVVDLWMRSVATGEPYDAEHRVLGADGAYRWLHSRGLPLRDVNGKIVRWYNLLTDIDERKRAEAELRRAYDHLTEAQRLSQTGSFTADLALEEHYWSDEFYRICEFEPGSTVTIQRLGSIVHPEDAALFEGAIGRAMAGTDPDFYFRIVTARGIVKHLRGFAHRIADRPVFVGAVQDVTASKMAQEALNRAGAELAHVSRVTTLSALTASIAHEVNQPLSGIITNAGTCLRMLAADPPDLDGARETTRRTLRDGNRAADVITRLRALFSKREFSHEPLDLTDATREVIALSSNDLQRNRIILRSELAGDLPTVAGDRIQLQQVILNLLRNAADAMVDVHDRQRQLLIRTERDDGERVRVTVRDSGVGLPAHSIDSVFDAFYTTKSGGMGIGLFVSRSIVESHFGRLWAEPNDGPGATFAFSIPCAQAGAGDAASSVRTP